MTFSRLCASCGACSLESWVIRLQKLQHNIEELTVRMDAACKDHHLNTEWMDFGQSGFGGVRAQNLDTQCARRVCPNAIKIMHYIVRKLNAVPATRNWLALRLSYGMNGILLPMAHLPSLTSYMRYGRPLASTAARVQRIGLRVVKLLSKIS